ncbi:MAG: hypothetical protein H0U54_07295 [Acidobacteria bacterium]|nr:hypothetical protein [Acidobacteriota bacterium]
MKRVAREPEMSRLLAENEFDKLLLTIVTLSVVDNKHKKFGKLYSFDKLRRDVNLSGGDS